MYSLVTQRNARIHVTLAILALFLGVALGLSTLEFALLFLTIAFVYVAEMLNTALEAVADLATSEPHSLAKIAKDVAAGAVLVAAGFAVIVGLLLFGPRLWALLASSG